MVENGFDVDDGCAVDGFEGADFEGSAVDLEDRDAMEAEGVGAVGAAGGEDAGEGIVLVAAGMDGEGVAAGEVEPGDEDDLVAFLGAVEGRGEVGVDGDPGIWGAFVTLFGGVGAVFYGGLDEADWLDGEG